jgi:hypothetical protein
MSFRPASWYAGLALTLLTVLILAVLGGWVLLRRERQGSQRQQGR